MFGTVQGLHASSALQPHAKTICEGASVAKRATPADVATPVALGLGRAVTCGHALFSQPFLRLLPPSHVARFTQIQSDWSVFGRRNGPASAVQGRECPACSSFETCQHFTVLASSLLAAEGRVCGGAYHPRRARQAANAPNRHARSGEGSTEGWDGEHPKRGDAGSGAYASVSLAGNVAAAADPNAPAFHARRALSRPRS